jgi:hypothetical protein
MVVVKFPASPRSVFVGDCIRLWRSHRIRPLAFAAMEGVNNRSINIAVGNHCSPSHSDSCVTVGCYWRSSSERVRDLRVAKLSANCRIDVSSSSARCIQWPAPIVAWSACHVTIPSALPRYDAPLRSTVRSRTGRAGCQRKVPISTIRRNWQLVPAECKRCNTPHVTRRHKSGRRRYHGQVIDTEQHSPLASAYKTVVDSGKFNDASQYFGTSVENGILAHAFLH